MTDRSRGYALRLEVLAPPEVLWQALLDPVQLAQWYAREARIDARASGSYRVWPLRGDEREARIDVFQPPNRLRLIYMPSAAMPAPDGVIVDDFILDGRGPVTHLCLLGSGFPRLIEYADLYQRIHDGWTRALMRLKILAEKNAVGVAQ